MLSFLNYLTMKEKDPPDWVILDIWAILSFIPVDIFLAKAFLILVVCLVVRNNSCGNSASSKFFLFNLNIVPLLFLAAVYNLFNCLFVSLTLTPWYFALFYNTVTLPWKNISLVSLIFSKFVKKNVDLLVATALYGFFNCLTNSSCWIHFGSTSNSFCYFKSTAINL